MMFARILPPWERVTDWREVGQMLRRIFLEEEGVEEEKEVEEEEQEEEVEELEEAKEEDTLASKNFIWSSVRNRKEVS